MSATYGQREEVKEMLKLALQLKAFRAAAEECDAPVATGMMPAGVQP
ncbi:MAG: hypothetical protein ACRD45_00645 [Bryobacteraceae bacterium]